MRTILKMDKRGTLEKWTRGQESLWQCAKPKDYLDRQYESRKGLAGIEIAKMHQYEDSRTTLKKQKKDKLQGSLTELST